MAFTLKQTVRKFTTYPEFGINSDSVSESIDVTYSAATVSGLDSDNRALVIFEVAIEGGLQSGSMPFSFSYSGSGNPLSEAEYLLKDMLKNDFI